MESARALSPLRLAILFLLLGLLVPLTASAGPKIVSRGGDDVEEEESEETPAPEVTIVTPEGTRAHKPVSEARPVVTHRITPDVTGFEIGFRGGSFTAFDDWVDPDGVSNSGGVGFAMRWRFVESWSIELGFDSSFRADEEANFSEERSLTNFGALFYFGEPWDIQGFMSFGALFSTVNMEHHYADEYSEGGLYIGGGADIYLDDWRFSTELRLTGMGRDDSVDDYWYSDQNYHRYAPDSRAALQWLLGAYYSF